MSAAGNQAGEVRHVDQVQRADFIGDLAHAGEINDAWISAAAADDQLGTLALGDAFQFVVINGLGFLGDSIGDNFVSLSGKVQVMAVSKVATVRQVQAKNGVSRLEDSVVSAHIRLAAGMRLYVGMLAPSSCLARSRARFSTTSANSQPP